MYDFGCRYIARNSPIVFRLFYIIGLIYLYLHKFKMNTNLKLNVPSFHKQYIKFWHLVERKLTYKIIFLISEISNFKKLVVPITHTVRVHVIV
jgi:hypothetical protein